MSTMPGFFADRATLELLRQRERFSWFARQLESRITSDVEMLRNHLNGSQSRPGQREKALVALALLGTVDAGESIAEFDPGDDDSLSVFHAIAADVWAHRMAG